VTDLLSIILNVISPIFIVAGIGFLVAKRWNPDTRIVSLLLVYVFVPMLVFKGIRDTQMSLEQLLQIGALVLIMVTAMTVIGLGVSRFFGWDAKLTGAFVMTLVLVNAANYGVPVNRFAFGATGEQVAIVFYALNNLMGNVVAIYYASAGQSPRKALLNVLKVPITWAALLGLAFNLLDLPIPLPLERAIDITAQGAIPMMLILLGLQLANTPLKGKWKPVLIGSGIRLVIAPLLAWGVALGLGMQGAVLAAAVVENGMPNAVLANAIAAEFNSDREYTALMTMVSTVASIVTLSVWIALLS
jgi:hypothetical protein